MRMLASAIVLISVFARHHSQGTSDSKCNLQELAIDAALGDPDAQHNLAVTA